MFIETKEQWERAKRSLESRSPQALAAFILTLAHAPNGIGNYVNAFAAADDPKATADILKNEIAFLREGERDYDYRHRRGFDFASRVDRTLDAIEMALLPKDPATAFALLTLFIESDGEIGSNCEEDNFGATEAFDRACEMIKIAARELPAVDTEPVLTRLAARDDHGLRGRLSSSI